MMKHLLWLLFAALLAASSPAAAGSLTLGVPDTGRSVLSSLPPTDAMCEPFGCPQAILTNSGGNLARYLGLQNFSRFTVLSRSPQGQRPSLELLFIAMEANPIAERLRFLCPQRLR